MASAVTKIATAVAKPAAEATSTALRALAESLQGESSKPGSGPALASSGPAERPWFVDWGRDRSKGLGQGLSCRWATRTDESPAAARADRGSP